eukprot:1662596-Prymnesium_polylepis.3
MLTLEWLAPITAAAPAVSAASKAASPVSTECFVSYGSRASRVRDERLATTGATEPSCELMWASASFAAQKSICSCAFCEPSDFVKPSSTAASICIVATPSTGSAPCPGH